MLTSGSAGACTTESEHDHANEAMMTASSVLAAAAPEDWWPSDELPAFSQQHLLSCQDETAAAVVGFANGNGAAVLDLDHSLSSPVTAQPLEPAAEGTMEPVSSRSSSPLPGCLSPQPSCRSPNPSCPSSQPSDQALSEPALQLHSSAEAPASLLQAAALQHDPQPTAGTTQLSPASAQRLQAVLAAAALQQGSMSDESDSDYNSDDSEEGACCVNCTSRLDDDYCMRCQRDTSQDAELFAHALAHPAPAQPQALGSTALVFDERMQLHAEASARPHPERPDRIRTVVARLMSSGLAGRCQRLPCREATRAEVEACHDPGLVQHLAQVSLQAAALEGGPAEAAQQLPEASELAEACVHLTPDTFANRHTSLCAHLAAGASIDVAVAVARGEVANAAAVVRPPGHHAESGSAMGFCFFNNAAVAARAAQAAGASRVLILDWDIHHGNGIHHIFDEDPSVLYMSVHRYDGGHFYPGTGGMQEVGQGLGEGFSVNIGWPTGGMADADYLAAFHHVFLPIAYEFAPDLIIIAAGYDAAAGDPMGGCHVSSAGFAHMTALLGAVAPLAVILEGGYNLAATAGGVEATLRVLLGERPPRLPQGPLALPSQVAMMTISHAISIQSRYWQSLRGLVRAPLANLEVLPQRIRTPQAELEEDEAGSSSGSEQGTPRVSAGVERMQAMVPEPASPASAAAGQSPRSGSKRRREDSRARGRLKWLRAASRASKESPTYKSRAALLYFMSCDPRGGGFLGKTSRRWAMSHALHAQSGRLSL